MSQQPVQTVASAITFLAQSTNPSSVDSRGFSRYDADFGFLLAEIIRKGYNLSQGQLVVAKRLCHKYRQQLSRAGFDLEVLAAEGKPPVPETVVIIADIINETEKAVRVLLNTGGECWLPKSQITLRHRVADSFEVEVPGWMAREKGIPAHKSLDKESVAC